MNNNALRAAFSLLVLASMVNDVRRKLHMVEIHSTVEKWAKRMPDATVETTKKGLNFVEKFSWVNFAASLKMLKLGIL